jgi:tetratricopeptide (TPR) repeat protein
LLDTLRNTTSAVRALLWERQSSGTPGLCQDDIASTLGVDRGTVSRALRRLRLAGEVKSRREHVTGHTYRVLVFQLTALGKERGHRSAASRIRDLPAVADLFVGRTRELAQIRAAVHRGGIVVVDGVPGVGKTALVRKAVGALSSSHLVLWTGLQPGTTPSLLADQLSRAAGVSRNGEDVDPHRFLPEAPALTTASVSAFLARHPKGVVWVLDDAQASSAPTQDALRDILAAFPRTGPHVAFVITQRELPWPVPDGATLHLSLKGLSRPDAINLTTALGLPDSRFETIFQETLGMPRYLRLASKMGISPGSTFASAVLNSLLPHQRSALIPLALSWGPLDLRSGLIPGITPDEAEGMVALAILDASDEGLQLAEPVARRLIETASWDDLIEGHRFLAMSEHLSPVERFVHACESEDTGLAFRLLSRHRNELIVAAEGRVQSSALRLSHLIPRGRKQGEVELLLAEVQRSLGDFVAASTFLERAFEQLPHDDPAAVQVAAMLSLTSLRAGHLEEAERWASQIRGLAQGHRWASVAALARGNVATYRGDFELGGSCLGEADRLARLHRQPEVRLMALHGLAFIALRKGDHRRALALAEEGLTLAEDRHRADFGRILRLVMSASKYLAGQFVEARQLSEQVLEEARATGDRTRVATALLNLAREAQRVKDPTKAIGLAREAAQVAESAQDRSLTAMCYAMLANSLKSAGRTTEARAVSKRASRIGREAGPSPSSPLIQQVVAHVQATKEPTGPRRRPSEPSRSARKGAWLLPLQRER